MEAVGCQCILGGQHFIFCSLIGQSATSATDSSRGRRSPYTPHEKFEGLTILRALKVGRRLEGLLFGWVKKNLLLEVSLQCELDKWKYLSPQLSQDGFLNQSDVKLLHEVGERARTLLHAYFRSPSGLFFSFSHLVCRSPVPGTYDTCFWSHADASVVS